MPWVADAAAGLGRGALLLIDYGYPAAELYDPIRRRDGTLRAYLRHRVHDDPYLHVGRQDLTAHVDVTAVERAAIAAGLTHLGTTTQAEFLVGLGTEDLLRAIQADPATTMEDYLAVRSALVRLLDPAAMGRFRVMAFARGWPARSAAGRSRVSPRSIAARVDQGSIWIDSTICRSSALTVSEAPESRTRRSPGERHRRRGSTPGRTRLVSW